MQCWCFRELGRWPLYIARFFKIIKFWCKIFSTDNIIMKKIYQQNVIDCSHGYTNWVSNVKRLLYTYGFAESFTHSDKLNCKIFPSIFKQRLIDNYTQEWHTSIENSNVLDLYRNCKTNLSYESYLDVLPHSLRMFISRIRLSAHSLRIQTCRYSRNRLPRNERYCQCCNTLDIEDEYHFILICPCYIDSRMIYIKKYFYVRPSMFKFTQLLQTQNKFLLLKLARYIKESLLIRNNIMTI